MAELGYIPQKSTGNRKTNRRNLSDKLLKNKSPFRLLGFFLAMAMPYGRLAPFGVSFLAQERELSLGAVFVFLATAMGSWLVCDRLNAAKYICSGLIYLAVLFVLDRGVKLKSAAAALAAGMCVFVSGIVTIFWQGFNFGDFLLLLCESAAVVAGAFVLEKGIRLMKLEKPDMRSIDTEEKISLTVTLALLVLGLKELYIGSVFSIMSMVAVVLLLIVAAGCGSAYSTGAGVILGVICGIGSDDFLPVLGTFGFCGFMSGMFSKFGRGGVVAGTVLANAMLAVYNNEAMESVLNLYEIMFAAVVFMFVKKRTITLVGDIICLDAAERAGIRKIKESLKERLGAIAVSLETMAKAMEGFSEKHSRKNITDIATVFDMAADKVCKRCRRVSVCWQKDFDFTYHSLFEMMKAMDRKGTVGPYDVNERFQSECINFSRLVAELNHQLDLNQVKCVWQSKVDESRSLMGEQLSGVSKVIDGLSADIESDMAFHSISVKEVEEKLREKEIDVYKVKVLAEQQGRQRVEICIRRRLWNEVIMRDTIKVMKELFQGEITVREKSEGNEYFATIEFCDAEKFVVETNFAEKAVSGANGDSYRFSYIRGGKYVIALSDGMGKGIRAAKESEAMLELLDSFLRAGFESRMAVKFLNSIMLLKSEEDSFVTMDICIIDLYTGEAEFIKTGAEPSFIIRSNTVDTVKVASLPVGVIAEMEAEIASKTVRDGDVIVMVTDGVETRDSGSMWVGEFISGIGGESGDSNLAEEILQQAIKQNDGQVKDDMTVLSVRVRCA